MDELRSLGEPSLREINARRGMGENQFGVKMGSLRDIAKRIKTDPQLATELWATGNMEAMMLATLIMKPKQLPVEELDRMVGSVTCSYVADWLSTNVVKVHPQKESRRADWMNSAHDFTVRMGWSLTTERVIKSPDGLDLPGLLTRIEAEMPDASEAARWTMNYCLAEIGINHPSLRDRALAIGEKLGAYKDYPVSKGCVSPYAPIWITEMVRRSQN